MVGAGVVAGDDDFDDFDGRPGPLFAVPAAALAAGLVVAVRFAGALRVVVLVVDFFAASRAFCCSAFSRSRASCCSFEGIFSVIRFKPEVNESISSFSLPFTGATLLVYAEDTRGTGGRWGPRAEAAVFVPRAFFEGRSVGAAGCGAALRLLDAGGGILGPRLTLRSPMDDTLEAILIRRDTD